MDVFAQRRAGVLLHPTSLPGATGNGDLGADAYRFVDFLSDCGISVWQTLPLGPTHDDLSPYQCLSVHAGNVRLVSLQSLAELGWLDDPHLDETQSLETQRKIRLVAAFNGFQRNANDDDRQAFARFSGEHAHWLDDYALYQALRTENGGRAWYDWPERIRNRRDSVLAEERRRLAGAIEQVRFEQFLFYHQWRQLRQYANDRGVLLFGDIPIFVAHDSAEVWAHREWFCVDAKGGLEKVAGVPPDYFSATGQRWGNPLYRWDVLEQDGFRCWIERIRSQLEIFDLVRIDHFRGFEAFWEIDADQETAMNGRWVKAPGEAFFRTLERELGELPLVAEDLGVITPEVTALREQFRFPGMKILQFAFDGTSDNPYLPHNHESRCAVYTGTHDNNTSLGWYQDLDDGQRDCMRHYLGDSPEPMPWLLVRTALSSVASLAVLPMQDVLGLDGAHRMNVPGISNDNWHWRFDWSQLQDEHRDRLRDWVALYGRKV